MTSIESYLDASCVRLAVNPAEAEDVREELRAHLHELVEEHVAEGMDRQAAAERALARFGDARALHDCLNRVHRGDVWWALRLKGLALGLLIGALFGVLAPIGGHLEFAARAFPLPADVDPSRAHIAINAMLAGGVIGLLSAGGRGLLAGWCVGSLLWLTEYVVHWIIGVASGAADAGPSVLSSVLLAPLLGGMFGAAVGAGTAAILSAAARVRPQIG
ncbi:MAG: hypothetical protein JSV79_11010 [Armatimonadota bacterium]|nr:MAG: hypothetical protein JSV79_11010 [Armatimonadota bacterium]